MSQLDKFTQQLNACDTRQKLAYASDIISYLQDRNNTIDCEDMTLFLENVISWISQNNFKVVSNGLEIVTLLVDRLKQDFRQYVMNVLPLALERLGDTHESVKSRCHDLLTKLVAHVISPQTMLDRIVQGFSHKNSNVRHQLLLFFHTLLTRYGSSHFQLSRVTPHVVKLLSDSCLLVRDAAFTTLVHMYRHVGERLRHDLQRKYELPQTKLDMLMSEFNSIQNGCSNASSSFAATKQELGHGDVIDYNDIKSQNSTMKSSLCSGSNGSMDEALFIKAFENVPRLYLSCAKDLNSRLVSVRETISDPKMEWNKRIDALKCIRGIVIAGGSIYEEFFSHLRSMIVGFQVTLRDLRSQVVREGCITLAYLCQQLKLSIDGICFSLLSNLIDLIPNSAKVVSTSAVVCIRFMLQHIQHTRLLPVLCAPLASSKSCEIRRACSLFIEQVLSTWTLSAPSMEKHSSVLQEALRRGLTDADAETRACSRRAYWFFAGHFVDKADDILKSLDNGQRRALYGGMSKCSSNSSLTAGPITSKGFRSKGHSVSGSQENISKPKKPVQSTKLTSAKKYTFPNRSNSAIDVQMVQRARANAYNGLLYQRNQPSTPKLSNSTLKPRRPLRVPISSNGSNNLNDISPFIAMKPSNISKVSSIQSQPGSRSTSPSPYLHYMTHKSQNKQNKPNYIASSSSSVSCSTVPSTPVHTPLLRRHAPTSANLAESRTSAVARTDCASLPDGMRSSIVEQKYNTSYIPLSNSNSTVVSSPSIPSNEHADISDSHSVTLLASQCADLHIADTTLVVPTSNLSSPQSTSCSVTAQAVLSAPSLNTDSAKSHDLSLKFHPVSQHQLSHGNNQDSAVGTCQLDSSHGVAEIPVAKKYYGVNVTDDRSDISDNNSICSDISYSGSAKHDSVHSWHKHSFRSHSLSLDDSNLHLDGDINTLVEMINSTEWSQRRNGMYMLQQTLSSLPKHPGFTVSDLRNICDGLNRMFMDPHTKVFSLFLDSLNLLLLHYHNDLHFWLYVLLSRLFAKLGSDLLGSLLIKINKTLNLISELFPKILLIQTVCRFFLDLSLTPNMKTKVAALNYFRVLLDDPTLSDLYTKMDLSNFLNKMIIWSSERKSVDVRNSSKAIIVRFYELNSSGFSRLASTLPLHSQESISEIFRQHTQKRFSATNSVTSSPLNMSLQSHNGANQPQSHVFPHSTHTQLTRRVSSGSRKSPMVMSPSSSVDRKRKLYFESGRGGKASISQQMSSSMYASVQSDRRYINDPNTSNQHMNMNQIQNYSLNDDFLRSSYANPEMTTTLVDSPSHLNSNNACLDSTSSHPYFSLNCTNAAEVPSNEPLSLPTAFCDVSVPTSSTCNQSYHPDNSALLVPSSSTGHHHTTSIELLDSSVSNAMNYNDCSSRPDKNVDMSSLMSDTVECLGRCVVYDIRQSPQISAKQTEKCFNDVSYLTKFATKELWNSNFRLILQFTLDYLKHMSAQRELALQCLSTMLQCDHITPMFDEHVKLLLDRVLAVHSSIDLCHSSMSSPGVESSPAHCVASPSQSCGSAAAQHARRRLLRAAEQCCSVIAARLSPSAVTHALCPLIQTMPFPANQAAVKTLTCVIECADSQLVCDHLDVIMPVLLQAYDNTESAVRKAAVFCMVTIHTLCGYERLQRHLHSLKSTKLKLLQLYISRSQQGQQQHPTASSPRHTSHPSASVISSSNP